MRFGPAPHGWMGLKPAENGIKIKKTYIATNFGISQLSLILPTKQTCNDTVGALNHFRIKVLCLFRSYSAVSIVKLYDIYIYAANYCFVRTSWNKGTYASLSDCACVRLKESFSILFFELGWERNWNSIFGSRGGEKKRFLAHRLAKCLRFYMVKSSTSGQAFVWSLLKIVTSNDNNIIQISIVVY